MTYTLGTAAKATGKAKTTISRAIDNGRISAKKNDKGEWEIDPAELHRVFPALQVDSSGTPVAKQHELVAKIHSDTRVLQAEIEFLKERLKDKENIISDLREDRDDWKMQATRLIEKHPPTTPTEARRGLFGFFGTKS